VGTAGSPAGANDARLFNVDPGDVERFCTTAEAKFDQSGDQNGFFDGIDDRAEVPDNPRIKFTDKLTISVWIRPARLTAGQNIVNKWYAVDSYGLALFDGRPNFSVAFKSSRRWGESFGVDASQPVEVNQWTHLAAVFDGRPKGGGNSGKIRLYVNGFLAGEASTRRGDLQQSERPLAIGNHPEWNPFEGRIDDLRLYRAALEPYQIQILLDGAYFGDDTNKGMDPPPAPDPSFYIGRVGIGRYRCDIEDVVDFEEAKYPCGGEAPYPRGDKCGSLFDVSQARRAGHDRIHAYWHFHGPDGSPRGEGPREWGRIQACLAVQQWRTYQDLRFSGEGWFIFGQEGNIFADIEHGDPETFRESGWKLCTSDAGVRNESNCEDNWQVLRGFLETVSSKGLTPGVYTRPALWNRWFGKDYDPSFGYRRFVLWLAGCGVPKSGRWTTEGVKAALPTVTEMIMGGMKTVLWQYDEARTWDATLQIPSVFQPIEAPRGEAPYRCTCPDVPVSEADCP
jgi:hypothetical protein